MSPFLLVRLTAVFLLVSNTGAAAATERAEWTLMVYMNAKNNLEPDAIANFREIAGIGSTAKVNVLVEMGRPKSHYTSEAEGWSGVLRFLVKKGQEPVLAVAVADLRTSPELSDLGSPAALDDFINWSIEKYPAKKYMLVIWNHGQGWRFQMAADTSIRQMATARVPSIDRANLEQLTAASEKSPQVGGFRAVSFDQETSNFLYNSDVQRSVEKAAEKLKRKLDIIGFDACLMSMLETAYAFRNSAALMVSSEELEPGAGWDYAAILKPLVARPAMSPADLSNAIVAAYKSRYGDFHMTTLSVVDLSKSESAAKAVSRFAGALGESLASERGNVNAARAPLRTYGAGDGLRTSIDLPSFLEGYMSATSSAEIRDHAKVALDATKQMVVTNYASALSSRTTGSKGIAIYFPADKAAFDTDPYKQGYVKNNTNHVVEFVARERWADFLQSYLQ